MKLKPKPAQPNDDPDFDPHELEEAVDEETSLESQDQEKAPEVDDDTEDLTEWDQPPGAAGMTVPKLLPEDEAPVGETLTQEGLDEAERERRIAAADPDYEA